jgi:hypothetical protein
MIRTFLVLFLFSVTASAQKPIDTYIGDINIAEAGEDELSELLPSARPRSFADYIAATSPVMAKEDWRNLLALVESLRLNKMAGGASGTGGTTSLVSRVAVPAVIGFGIERGGILQSGSSTATTLRANALGLAKLAVGAEQFPYCPAVADSRNCSPWSRNLRRFSGTVAFENNAVTGRPPLSAGDLSGDEYRMSSWGVRFDLTPSNNLDDPKYFKDWGNRIEALRGTDFVGDFSKAISDFVNTNIQAFSDAETTILEALKGTADPGRRKAILKKGLDDLAGKLVETNPDFLKLVREVQKASAAYDMARDDAVRDAQTHKMSLEYMNLHPANQPGRSTLRFIYSHQPTEAPLLVTLNFATSFYNQGGTDSSPTRFRDIQFAAQLDRRLPPVERFGHPTLTFAAYYQWMKEDALLSIPAEDLAPGTALALPGDASVLLDTKGHIFIAQAKLSFPIGENVRIPLSVSWANRTELLKEDDVRGQIGFTLDMDSLFQ